MHLVSVIWREIVLIPAGIVCLVVLLFVGFKLSSLNRIIDTKSTTDNEMTLLHYLVQMLEAKVKRQNPPPPPLSLSLSLSLFFY